MNPIAEISRKIFGIPNPYPIQLLVISNILEQKNQIVVLPTGGGKSLCYQLPVFFLDGITLVVSPLLSLIEDQARRLKQANILSQVIQGGQSDEERRKRLSGESKIIFCTPESLAVQRTLKQLAEIKIAHLVIDEAHCISEWGETFRPAYLELHQAVQALTIPVVSAFTATASQSIMQKIKEILFKDIPVEEVTSNPDRSNITYRVVPVFSKPHSLTALAKKYSKPLIVFSRSRKRCEYAARILKQRIPNTEVRFYHAGLNKEERKNIEEWFLYSGNGILTATSAYGMGIDKPDIRTCIHMDIPLSIEAYLQESGRIGRDQKPSDAILLFSQEDILFIEKLDQSIPRQRYQKMLDYADSSYSCRREFLLSMLNHPLKESCSGCDLCGSTAMLQDSDKPKVIQFVKKNKKRFTCRECALILTGARYAAMQSQDFHVWKGFGQLSGWEIEDAEEALQHLIAVKELRLLKKGFWKYKITL